MKVLLISQGSTGDIYPVIRLGKALKDAGHTVRFASAPLYREPIEKAGLEFLHTPPDWEKPVFIECMRELDRQPNPIWLLRQIYRSGISFMGELIDVVDRYIQEHDLVVCSYVFPHFRVIAKRYNIPFATLTFCHSVVPTPDYPPDVIPKLSGLPDAIQRKWNGFWWNLTDKIVDWAVNDIIDDILKKKGLPPMCHFITKPADMSIIGVSPALMKNSERIDERFQFTGYLRWQSEENPALEDTVKAFCGDERVPVLTFGSVSFDHIQEVMSRFEKHWPRGQKIIIQSGWAGLSVEISRPEILIVGQVSHDQLFKHASCVIHHGGAGTTASVLHAGVPQVIVPHFGDQDFWGKEIKRLGVGVVIAQKKWPENLARAVSKVTSRPKYAARAQVCAEQLAQEDGPAQAVRTLEHFAQRSSEKNA